MLSIAGSQTKTKQKILTQLKYKRNIWISRLNTTTVERITVGSKHRLAVQINIIWIYHHKAGRASSLRLTSTSTRRKKVTPRKTRMPLTSKCVTEYERDLACSACCSSAIDVPVAVRRGYTELRNRVVQQVNNKLSRRQQSAVNPSCCRRIDRMISDLP